MGFFALRFENNTLSNYTRRVLQNAHLVGKTFPTRKPDYRTVFRRKKITPLVRDEEAGGSNPLEPTIFILPTIPDSLSAFPVVERPLPETGIAPIHPTPPI